jgi:hypothetical protein
VGVFLFLGLFLKISAGAATVLFSIFSTVLVSIFFRNVPLEDCGCLGRLAPSFSPSQMLVLDLLFLGLSVLVFRHRERRLTIDGWLTKC